MEDNNKTEGAVNEDLSEKIIDDAIEKADEKAEDITGEKETEKTKDNTSGKKAEEEIKAAEKDTEGNKSCNEEKADDEFAKAKAKADEYLDKYQRLMAEFYNYRERTTKEKAGMYNDGLRDTVEKVLPVIDNLERAVNAQREKAAADDAFFKGVDMILKQFKEILKGMGVEEISAVGEKFDPKLHSAVSHVDDENFGENTISIEMLKGYKLGEKVIRHSMVQVAN